MLSVADRERITKEAGKGQECEIGIQLQRCNAMVSSSLSEEGEKTEGRERERERERERSNEKCVRNHRDSMC